MLGSIKRQASGVYLLGAGLYRLLIAPLSKGVDTIVLVLPLLTLLPLILLILISRPESE